MKAVPPDQPLLVNVAIAPRDPSPCLEWRVAELPDSLSCDGRPVKRMRFLRTAAVCAAAGLCCSHSLLAGGVVTNCSDADLRAAIADGGWVSFDCDGVIALTNTLPISQPTEMDATGRSVVITGSNTVRLFTVGIDTPLTLRHLTLADGFAQFGGAITFGRGPLTILDCNLVSNCVAGGSSNGQGTYGLPAHGGAIYGWGFLHLTNVNFIGNSARGGDGTVTGGDGWGGAIAHSGGQLTADHVRFLGNSARAGAPAWDYRGALGGACYIGTTTVVIANCRFESNQCGFGARGGYAGGGGLAHRGDRITILNSVFVGNQVRGAAGDAGSQSLTQGGDAWGGAFFKGYGWAWITASTFWGNLAEGGPPARDGPAGAGEGGGIWSYGPLEITSTTVTGNEARGGSPATIPGGGFGGGIYLDAGYAVLNHLTIASNLAQAQGGGLWISPAYGPPHPPLLQNCILSYSASGNNVAGPVVDEGGNLSSDGTPALSAADSRNHVDPRLGPLGDYGGPTLTLPLLAGSPANDAARSEYCPGADQRGAPRPQDAACDVGAFEATRLTISLLPSGDLLLRHVGVPRESCMLMRSTNLLVWTSVGTQTADDAGAVSFLVPGESQPQFFQTVVP